ncbi:MAG: SprT family zinc-dependent metalloprotease [Kiritimatiellae bacterium]|jgi:predicted metal-dependent hydrolase|nr:SprT family zinc-dependent metalloprotease [Kiritimatiellia bacterium]
MKSELEQHVTQFGGRCITYVLYRTDRKNVRVVVEPDLSVVVYAPFGVSAEEIELAVEKRAGWIARTLVKVDSYHPLPTPKQYISGETFVYLGRQYRLKVDKNASGTTKLVGKYLHVSAADALNYGDIQKKVDDWYREHAITVFDRYLSKCYAVASRHGVPKPILCVRNMKRRWGSCAASGRITLNLGLVLVPVHCIEYVIMHELCHLKHHNHSKAFYRLLTQCLPDWPKRKEVLRKVIIPAYSQKK